MGYQCEEEDVLERALYFANTKDVPAMAVSRVSARNAESVFLNAVRRSEKHGGEKRKLFQVERKRAISFYS